MNLSVRASVESMMAHVSSISTFVEDHVSDSVAASEAQEALSGAMEAGRLLMNLASDMEVAQGSLESCGYSTTWFECINADGRFLDTINVDLVNLLGSDSEKADVCMEGIMTTIWNVIKRIWDWIVETFNKVVNFFKNLIGVFRGDQKLVERCEGLIKIVSNCKSPMEINTKIGEAINAIEGGGGMAFDARELYTRISICTALLTWFTDISGNIFPAFGTTKDMFKNGYNGGHGAGMFDGNFLEYAVRHQAGDRQCQTNPVVKNFVEALNRNPGSIVEKISSTGFRGFTPVKNPSGLKSMMEEVGITFIDCGGKWELKIDQIEDKVHRVNYVTIYNDLQCYQDVLQAVGAQLSVFETSHRNYTTVKDALEFDRKKVAEQVEYMDKNPPKDEHGRLDRTSDAYRQYTADHRAFMYQGTCFQELVMIVAKLLGDYAGCENRLRRIFTTFETASKKAVEEDKKK